MMLSMTERMTFFSSLFRVEPGDRFELQLQLLVPPAIEVGLPQSSAQQALAAVPLTSPHQLDAE